MNLKIMEISQTDCARLQKLLGRPHKMFEVYCELLKAFPLSKIVINPRGFNKKRLHHVFNESKK